MSCLKNISIIDKKNGPSEEKLSKKYIDNR